MEIIDLVIILNILGGLFIAVSGYQAITNYDKMPLPAYHHFVSHSYLILFFVLAFDAYYLKGYLIPFLISFLHIIQHVFKENLRLLKSGEWSKGVADE